MSANAARKEGVLDGAMVSAGAGSSWTVGGGGRHAG